MNLPVDRNDIKILALDLGMHLGWADIAGGIIDSDVVTFSRKKGRKTIPDEHEGKLWLEAESWIRHMLRTGHYDIVAYEVAMGIFKSFDAGAAYHGFRTTVQKLTAYYNIPLFPVTQSTLKKFATGMGNADKERMLNTARMKWPLQEIRDDNQADALWILEYTLHCLEREPTNKVLTLLQID